MPNRKNKKPQSKKLMTTIPPRDGAQKFKAVRASGFTRQTLQWYIIGSVLLAAVVFFFADQPLTSGLKSLPWILEHRNDFLFYIIDELGRPKNWIVGSGLTLIALTYLLYIKKGDRVRQQWVRYGGRVFIAVTIANMLVAGIKFVAGRYRPINAPDNVSWDVSLFNNFNLFAGNYNKFASLPSGHTANIVAVFFIFYFIKHNFRHRRWFITAMAVVMAQRVVTLNHYLSDIIIGFTVGLVGAYLATWFWVNFIKIGDGK